MTTAPGAHSWIDKVAEMFTIVDRQGAQIRSYKMAELKDLPNVITGVNAPCVVHGIRGCRAMYSAGGPTILFWSGLSDFHLFKDVKPANYSDALPFFPLILAAAMSDVTLGGNVTRFQIPDQPNALRFVTFKNSDGSDSHQGIEVNWEVKQTVTGSYTISA